MRQRDSLVPDKTFFRKRLITWFEKNRRDMPWRRQRTPYRVWISEIMLQQTQVQQAIPYYHRFLKQFPNIKELEKASLDQVLKAWEGMGYYARARNLYKAAQVIEREYHGIFPNEYEAVRRLPGIGPYTAAAILSIAFNQRYAVVDGNVIRVLARVLAYKGAAKSTAGKIVLQAAADELLSLRRPGAFNEAIMELGAMICTPTNPLCQQCPVARYCKALQLGKTAQYPVKTAKKIRPHYEIAAGIVWRNGKILLAKRPEHGLLGGLWEFPGGKKEPTETLERTVVREVREELGISVRVRDFYMKVNHQYSHFTITLYVYHCDWIAGTPKALGCSEWQWVAPHQLVDFAFPRANGKIIQQLLND